MSLAAGARLGPYEIVAPLGAGGMGEVYRAHDARLKRDVAIKVLPPLFSTDEERLARFAREAQVLAALNHPNIAGIYGIEESGEGRALVMELVEGTTLAHRLERGPIAVDEAIPIARQIADALEAAHEKGIIHRDLKPANIAFTADGQVKVLDFGLAKALEPEGATDSSNSPTLTLRATQAGVILGTAAYMSPEQARGRVADKRTDVWAFGCVLYEMLTGKRAFEGEDVTDTIAAVVRSEPDWNALPSDVPSQIRLLIMRCLVKDRKQRISDIGVARFLMAETIPAPPAPAAVLGASSASASRKRVTLATSIGALVGVALTALSVWAAAKLRPSPPAQPMRFSMALPQPVAFQGADRDIAISPSGSHIVYRGGAQVQLFVRAIDQLDAQPLTGTSGARQPFFSPDGRWVGFFVGQELRKVSITGGPAITLCRFAAVPRGASWGDDDTIVFATNDSETGLQRVSAGGGEPTTLTTLDAARAVDHVFPFVLPGGRGVLFTIPPPASQLDNAQVAVFDPRTNQSKTLVRGGSDATYVNSGHLVYAAAGTLRAVRFDLERLEVTSDPVPVEEQVSASPTGAANYAVSHGGTLVFVRGTGPVGIQRALVWVNRQGREEPIEGAPLRAYTIARLSPDGTRIALDIRDQEQDIWVWDRARQTLTRLTVDPATDWAPLWMPDSRRILFSSARAGPPNLYWQAADGTGTVERLTNSPVAQFAHSLTPDGTRVLVFEAGAKTAGDIAMFTLTRPSSGSAEQRPGATGSAPAVSAAKPTAASGAAPTRTEPLIQTAFIEWLPAVSPDGRWLAYATNESGQFEVHVRPFPNVNDGRWPISTGGGTKPVWARSGRELFYLDSANNLMSVPVQTTGSAFSAGNPVKLLAGRYYAGAPPNRAYDVSPDGQRFLMIKDSASAEQTQSAAPASLVVVVNWLEEIKQRAGGAR